MKLAASFPTPEICRAVASATNTVCSGEILQTRHRKNFELSQKEYFRVLQMKTGELFALSCDMAAFLGNATPSHRTVLREFGMPRLRLSLAKLNLMPGVKKLGITIERRPA